MIRAVVEMRMHGILDTDKDERSEIQGLSCVVFANVEAHIHFNSVHPATTPSVNHVCGIIWWIKIHSALI